MVGGWRLEAGGQWNGRSMAGSSLETFYCKPWDSSMVSGCGWRWLDVGVGRGWVWVVGGGQLNGRSMAESSVGKFHCKP